MAVGGMVGGGIFSVLGVVIGMAGQWAWLSFLIAGVIALISAHSYSRLAIHYKEGGGAFTFLNEIDHMGSAGSLSWILILGYILTVSVYAFTFGHYVAHVFDLGSWFPRVLAFAIIALLALVNLRGVGDSAKVEIVTVWGKLFVLLGLALFGLIDWKPEAMTQDIESKNWTAAIVGAATIFMAYEGFQLLSYDYEELKKPSKTLPRATISAIISVILVYIMVSIGATMLVGADTLIEKEEIALSIAGKNAMGTTGLVLVTIAAAFSTGSAINATLFSTARLIENVAEKNQLPRKLSEENKANVPYYAILSMAVVAAALAAIGSLSTLVDAASLIFLITFGVVNYLAFRQKVKWRWLCMAGTSCCLVAIALSAYKQIQERPIPLLIMIVVMAGIFIGRPIVLKKLDVK